MAQDKDKDKKTIEAANLSEEVQSLFEGADVTPELKEKIGTVFEAALASRVKKSEDTIRTTLDEEYEEKLLAATKDVYEELEESINMYLDRVITEWMEENKLEVQSGIRMEIAEEFIDGLKGLFEQHYVEIPEGKEDILATAEKKAADSDKALHESLQTIATLKNKIAAFEKDDVVRLVTEGLTDTQKEKLNSLIEGVNFEDVESFTKKVKTIKESVFKGDTGKKDEEPEKTTLKEEAEQKAKSNSMDRYLKALG